MGVEFLLEVCKHVSGGSVDVGNRLCGDEDPEWSWRGLYKATDLVAEGARRIGRSRGLVVPQRWGVIVGYDARPVLGRGRVWSGMFAMLVRKTLMIESASATAMPARTPSSATPRNAMIKSRNLTRR